MKWKCGGSHCAFNCTLETDGTKAEIPDRCPWGHYCPWEEMVKEMDKAKTLSTISELCDKWINDLIDADSALASIKKEVK